MKDKLRQLLEPNPAFSDSISTAYEFLRVATYGERVPHTVVFINDNGFLKIPVSKFEVGDYQEWMNPKVLPSREVGRAAAELSLYR